MDIVKLLTSVFLGVAVQTATLFVFHRIRGPFKELGILQKEMMILREKIQENSNTTVRYVAKKHYRRKTSVPKPRSRLAGRNSPLYYQKGVATSDDSEERSTPLQNDPSNIQSCSGTNETTAPEVKLQDLERICYDLEAKMKHFKRKTVSNHLRIKDYAKGIKEYAENLQAEQDGLRQEVASIFYKLDDDMNLLDDDMEIRLSNMESQVHDLIQAKLKADRRKGWCSRTIRII